MNQIQYQRYFLVFNAGLFLAWALTFVLYVAWPVWGEFGDRDTRRKFIILLSFSFSFILLNLVLFALQRIDRIYKTQRWLINAVNWNVQQLKAHGLADLPDKNSEPDGGIGHAGMHTWPWGTHHTELLGHIDAAARQFWRLYDPGDPSTAPTNEMVSDWLQSERGTSKEKAKAIASILRADGLPTGPRR